MTLNTKTRNILILIGILLLPSLAFADTLFGPYRGDLSIQYLRFIFGGVEGTDVTAGGMTVLKTVLTSFNMAVMTLGAIVITYSMLVSTLNTAHDGEMLGKEWSSVWIPMRAAMGFALLLPAKGTGSYAVIQVFVMWVVTQGIYAADYIWAESVDSVMQGGLTPPKLGDKSSQAYVMAQSIFTSLVCAKQAAIDNNTSVGPVGPVDDKYVFGVTGIAKSDACGSVELEKSGEFAGDINQQIAIMITALSPVADDFITSYDASSSEIPEGISNNIYNEVENAGGDYVAAMNQAVHRSSWHGKRLKKLIDGMKESGWVMAGSSFLAMSKASQQQISAKISVPGYDGWSDQGSSGQAGEILKYVPDAKAFGKELELASSITLPASMTLTSTKDVNKFLHSHLGPVRDGFLYVLTFWENLITGSGGSKVGNPLITLMHAGNIITNLIIVAYVAFAGAMIALGSLAYGAGTSVLGWLGAGAGWGAIVTFMNFATAPIMILFGLGIGVGVTWGYYVPLIPFIVFTMGVFGWIVLVIEAMVAAPLMAIGVLHPEGKHTVFGEAHAGIMLIAGVFLRPALMIVGLVASLVMCYVVVLVLSIGFTPVATTIAVQSFSIPGMIAMMVFYTMFIVIGLNKCFALIHILPDRVMRWIGQPGEQGGGAEREMEQLKQGASETGRAYTDTGSMGASGAGEIQRQGESLSSQRKSKLDQQNKDAQKSGPSAE